MDQPYSFAADLLSKFQSSPEWIKALWLIAPSLTLLGLGALIARVLREALRSRGHAVRQPEALPERGVLEGHLLYGIYRTTEGELVLYADGRSESLGTIDPPPRPRLQ